MDTYKYKSNPFDTVTTGVLPTVAGNVSILPPKPVCPHCGYCPHCGRHNGPPTTVLPNTTAPNTYPYWRVWL